MIIIRNPAQLQAYLGSRRAAGLRTGFVPTMGALHAGHVELIRASAAQADLTVCSIFVNPTQFNDPSDFRAYPTPRAADIRLLTALPAELLFIPATASLYPHGLAGLETYPLGPLGTRLEGAFRPGHFQGVCQVMARLLRTVQPDYLFMGQKDYQQCLVVKRLLDLLRLPARLVTVPTIREADGLAMSSRNVRIRKADRPLAPLIHQALQGIRAGLAPGGLDTLRETAEALLTRSGFRVEYVEIADAGSLEPVRHWDGVRPLVALAAAFLGEVRLIDNLPLHA